MSDSTSYLRYVIVEVTGRLLDATVNWEGRVATAAEGFQLLEARIADSILSDTPYPRVALIDCSEGRVLGFSGKTPPGTGLVDSAIARARSFPLADRAPAGQPGVEGTRDTIQDAAQQRASGNFVPPLDAGDGAPHEEGDSDAAGDIEDEADPSEEEVQPFVDAFVNDFLAGRKAQRLYQTVCDNIEASDRALEFDEEPILAVRREDLVEALAAREPADVRKALGLSATARITTDHWIRFASEVVLAEMLGEDEEARSIGPHLVTDSAGRSIVLAKSTSGFSFGEVTVTWHGAYRSWEEYLDRMPGEWFLEEADVMALPASERRALVREVRKR